VKDSGEIAPATPAIVYPDNSYFGEVLNVGERLFGTRNHGKDPVCETVFSSGMKELTLKGIGVSLAALQHGAPRIVNRRFNFACKHIWQRAT
jgi:hypothetical protein